MNLSSNDVGSFLVPDFCQQTIYLVDGRDAGDCLVLNFCSATVFEFVFRDDLIFRTG